MCGEYFWALTSATGEWRGISNSRRELREKVRVRTHVEQ